MKLPTYQGRGALDPSSPRLLSPDTAIARSMVSFGDAVSNFGEARGRIEARTSEKAKADRERSENLQLENDLLATQNSWQQRLLQAKEESSETGENFADQFSANVLQPDAEALFSKYENHHDQDYVRLKIAQAQNPLTDEASKFEFSKGWEFKKRVVDDKVASLAASFTLPGVSLEQAEKEFKEFVDKSVSGNADVRQHGYAYGLRTIQKAYVAATAGRDKEGFLNAYRASMSGADSKVLPPHLSATITNAQAQGADPNLILGIGWIESRLNPNAGRPTSRDGKEMSSAEGMFQVLAGNNRTAEATRNALGISREDVRDVDKVSTALSAFLVRKQQWMRDNRIEPTPGKTYMMWNLGEGAAAAVLRANPNERIETVLSRVWSKMGPEFVQKAIYNNPSMYKPGQTVSQVVANYETKVRDAMGVAAKISDGAGLTTEDRTKSLVTQFAGIQGDKQFVTGGDIGEIAENVIADVGKEQKALIEVKRGQQLLSGEIRVDPYSSDDRRAVEKALDAHLPTLSEAITQGDGAALSTVRSLADAVDHIPEPLRNAMRATMESGETGAKTRVYGTLLDLKKADATAFSATNFDADTENRIKEYEAYTVELRIPPAKALELIERERAPDFKARKSSSSTEVNKELGKISNKKMLGALGADTVGVSGVDENRLSPIIRSHFERIYRDAREQGKDKEQSEALATVSIKDAFGVTTVMSGGQEASVMLFPPEQQFKPLSNGHAWIAEQARNHLAAYLLTSGRAKNRDVPGGLRSAPKVVPAWKEAEDASKRFDVRLVSTADTEDDVRHGRTPRYDLWFRNDQGQVEKVAGNFTPDYAEAKHADASRFAAGQVQESAERRKQRQNVRKWLNDPDGHGLH